MEQEEIVMQINGSAIRYQAALSPEHLWEAAKVWARTHIRQETLFDAALTLATLGSAGFVLVGLHRIVLSWTATGF
jgi:hypothetical protein